MVVVIDRHKNIRRLIVIFLARDLWADQKPLILRTTSISIGVMVVLKRHLELLDVARASVVNGHPFDGLDACVTAQVGKVSFGVLGFPEF